MRLKKWSPFADNILESNIHRSSLGKKTSLMDYSIDYSIDYTIDYAIIDYSIDYSIIFNFILFLGKEFVGKKKRWENEVFWRKVNKHFIRAF